MDQQDLVVSEVPQDQQENLDPLVSAVMQDHRVWQDLLDQEEKVAHQVLQVHQDHQVLMVKEVPVALKVLQVNVVTEVNQDQMV